MMCILCAYEVFGGGVEGMGAEDAGFSLLRWDDGVGGGMRRINLFKGPWRGWIKDVL
jgi:hypothetical protein